MEARTVFEFFSQVMHRSYDCMRVKRECFRPSALSKNMHDYK